MERHIEHRRDSGSFWAYVLIIVGILWILKKVVGTLIFRALVNSSPESDSFSVIYFI